MQMRGHRDSWCGAIRSSAEKSKLIPSFDGRYYENTKPNPKFLVVLTTGGQARSIAYNEPAVPSGSRVHASASRHPFSLGLVSSAAQKRSFQKRFEGCAYACPDAAGLWGERRENPLFESRRYVAEFRSHDPYHTDHTVSSGVDPGARGTFGQPSAGGCGRRVLNDVCVGAESDPDPPLHLCAVPRGVDPTARAPLLWGVICNGIRDGVDPGGLPL
jgi:hypothetical protein